MCGAAPDLGEGGGDPARYSENNTSSSGVPGVARVFMLGDGTRPLGSGALKSTIESVVREA